MAETAARPTGKELTMLCMDVEYTSAATLGGKVMKLVWSIADWVMDKRRHGMSPITLEMILFLMENEDLWDINDVVLADIKRKEKNK
jgi:hypothetical protein